MLTAATVIVTAQDIAAAETLPAVACGPLAASVPPVSAPWCDPAAPGQVRRPDGDAEGVPATFSARRGVLIRLGQGWDTRQVTRAE